MQVNEIDKVADIIRDAGGRIVGRTRLQKIAYILTVTGLEHGFNFRYKHFGPYSQMVADAALKGGLLGRYQEVEQTANWGGSYSIYSIDGSVETDTSSARTRLATLAAGADAIVLELTATAVFLFKDGYRNAWEETARRKPEKVSEGRLEQAKELLSQFRNIETPNPLPVII